MGFVPIHIEIKQRKETKTELRHDSTLLNFELSVPSHMIKCIVIFRDTPI